MLIFNVKALYLMLSIKLKSLSNIYMIRLHVPALEEKVNILMARLDAASRIDTGQRGDSTDYNVNDDSNTEMPHNPH